MLQTLVITQTFDLSWSDRYLYIRYLSIEAIDMFLIPRNPMIPSDLPFTFKHLQFPPKVAFTMTIIKSQGQTPEEASLYL